MKVTSNSFVSLLALLAFSSDLSVLVRGKDVDMDNSEAVIGHREDFKAMDTNGDQNLDATEVKKFYKDLQISMNQDDFSAFFIASDKDENGLISEEEYIYTSLIYDETGLDLNDYKFR